MADIVRQSRRKWWRSTYRGTVYRYPDGEIVCDDALNLLAALRDGSASVIFLDPPFNLGKTYGRNGKAEDRKTEGEYGKYMARVIVRATEVLEPGGALYLYHIPKWAVRLAVVAEGHLEFRHWIAVSMKNGFVRGQRLYPAHYALLYYTKGPPKAFSRPKIPKPVCARCKKDLRDYGGYKRYVEDGINLSDVWDDISPVRHRRFKHRRSNELPLKLVRRILEISGSRNGLLVDPFSGAGSMIVAAREAGMRFVGGDVDHGFLKVIDARLNGEVLAS
jgi:site-specific DNA-methyltransferase (adenine-specific)